MDSWFLATLKAASTWSIATTTSRAPSRLMLASFSTLSKVPPASSFADISVHIYFYIVSSEAKKCAGLSGQRRGDAVADDQALEPRSLRSRNRHARTHSHAAAASKYHGTLSSIVPFCFRIHIVSHIFGLGDVSCDHPRSVAAGGRPCRRHHHCRERPTARANLARALSEHPRRQSYHWYISCYGQFFRQI